MHIGLEVCDHFLPDIQVCNVFRCCVHQGVEIAEEVVVALSDHIRVEPVNDFPAHRLMTDSRYLTDHSTDVRQAGLPPAHPKYSARLDVFRGNNVFFQTSASLGYPGSGGNLNPHLCLPAFQDVHHFPHSSTPHVVPAGIDSGQRSNQPLEIIKAVKAAHRNIVRHPFAHPARNRVAGADNSFDAAGETFFQPAVQQGVAASPIDFRYPAKPGPDQVSIEFYPCIRQAIAVSAVAFVVAGMVLNQSQIGNPGEAVYCREMAHVRFHAFIVAVGHTGKSFQLALNRNDRNIVAFHKLEDFLF